MNYRNRLYAGYVTDHTHHLLGEPTLDSIKQQFPVWKWYYGKFFKMGKTARILDTGCGNGGFIGWLQQMGFENSCGIDISKEQVELAHKLGFKNIEHADICDFLRNKRETFDVICARDLFEHFSKEEIISLIDMMQEALKAEGMLIIQTTNAESLFSGRYRYGDYTHESSFTRTSLEQVFRAAGFRDISCFSTGTVPKGLVSLVRYILWKCIEVFIRMYMLVEVGSGSGIFTQSIIAVARK